MRKRESIVVLPALVAAIMLLMTPAEAITIDAFVDQLPPNPDLPASGWELIFVGTMCDAGPFGGSCPPGTIVNHLSSDHAAQSSLPNVLGGGRDALLTRVGTSGNSDTGFYEGVMCHNHGPAARSIFDLSYGLEADLNADLTGGAATGLEVFLLDGDLDDSIPPRPVPVTITVTSRRGTPQEATASVTLSILNDATSTLFLFSAFAGVDFTDVDRLVYRFDTTTVSAVDYCIGPLKTDEVVVPVERRSWGAIKSLYR